MLLSTMICLCLHVAETSIKNDAVINRVIVATTRTDIVVFIFKGNGINILLLCVSKPLIRCRRKRRLVDDR